jgi:hypothetical protein
MAYDILDQLQPGIISVNVRMLLLGLMARRFDQLKEAFGERASSKSFVSS